MTSSLFPAVVIFAVLLIAGASAGSLGVVISALSMLILSPMNTCTRMIGPLVQVSHKILLMHEVEDAVMERSNTLKNIGSKLTQIEVGFISGANAICSFGLFVAVLSSVGVNSLDLLRDPQLLPGFILGAVMPLIFSALTLLTMSQVRSVLSGFFLFCSLSSNLLVDISFLSCSLLCVFARSVALLPTKLAKILFS
jgi:Na+/H+-translocating membrane pyrophosphatase